MNFDREYIFGSHQQDAFQYAFENLDFKSGKIKDIVGTCDNGKWLFDNAKLNTINTSNRKSDTRIQNIFGTTNAEVIEETGPHKCVNNHCNNKTYPLNVFCDDCRAKIGW